MNKFYFSNMLWRKLFSALGLHPKYILEDFGSKSKSNFNILHFQLEQHCNALLQSEIFKEIHFCTKGRRLANLFCQISKSNISRNCNEGFVKDLGGGLYPVSLTSEASLSSFKTNMTLLELLMEGLSCIWNQEIFAFYCKSILSFLLFRVRSQRELSAMAQRHRLVLELSRETKASSENFS